MFNHKVVHILSIEVTKSPSLRLVFEGAKIILGNLRDGISVGHLYKFKSNKLRINQMFSE